MSATDVGDVVRFVNILLASGIIMAGLGVSYRYARLFWSRQGKRTLLRRHVAVIAASYIGLCVMCLVDIFTRVHEPITWHAPVYSALFIAGLFALRDIDTHMHRQTRRADADTP